MRSFLPRVRWRYVLPVVALLVAFPAFWLNRRRVEADRRRTQLLHEHSVLTADLSPDYVARRAQVQRLVLRSVGPWGSASRSDRFSLDSLREGPVLYARTRLGEARGADTVLPSLAHRYPDELLPCLGVEWTWARELFDKGEFLRPEYVDAVRGTENTDRLAALRSDLHFRLRRDAELLVRGLRRRWFVLAVDEARASVDGPTRVYVYDLRDDSAVLQVRSEGTGVRVIPFQIAGIPSTHRRGAPNALGVNQHDCAVANEVRAAFGVANAGLSNLPPEPRPSPNRPAAPDAAPLRP